VTSLSGKGKEEKKKGIGKRASNFIRRGKAHSFERAKAPEGGKGLLPLREGRREGTQVLDGRHAAKDLLAKETGEGEVRAGKKVQRDSGGSDNL